MPEVTKTKANDLVLKVLTSVTVVSSLMVFFGWKRSDAIAAKYGYDPSLLGLSVEDYLLRSVVPVVQTGLALTFGAIIWYLVRERIFRVLDGVSEALPYLGAVLAVLAFPRVSQETSWIAPALLFSSAALLATYARGLQEKAWRSRWDVSSTADHWKFPAVGNACGLALRACVASAVFLFVSFMASSSGVRQVQQDLRLENANEISLVSDSPLYLDGVVETERGGAFVYSGLTLLFAANENYFLLPLNRSWEHDPRLYIVPEDAATITVHDKASIPCNGFSDLAPGSVYPIGDSFVSAGVAYSVSGYRGNETGGVTVVSTDDESIQLLVTDAMIGPDIAGLGVAYKRWTLQYEQFEVGLATQLERNQLFEGPTGPRLALEGRPAVLYRGGEPETITLKGDLTLPRFGGSSIGLSCLQPGTDYWARISPTEADTNGN